MQELTTIQKVEGWIEAAAVIRAARLNFAGRNTFLWEKLDRVQEYIEAQAKEEMVETFADPMQAVAA